MRTGASRLWLSSYEKAHLPARRINRVLEVLRSDELDDEDRPERLKAVLRDELGVIEPPSHLDAVVLGLLHRFNEDEKPSGVALEPLTAFAPRDPARPSSSMSRSSSFRRNFKAQLPASLVNLQRSAAGPPHSGNSSPFRSPAGSPSHSPWSSPRPAPLSLNATAAEFKLAGGSSSSRARSRSPLPQSHGNALHSPGPSSATWAFQSSPLGTPKYAPGSAASSYTASGSYFPAPAKSSALAQSASQQSAIPRNPWAEDGEDDPIPTLERSSSPTQWSQTSSEDPTNFLPSTLFTNASPADQPVIDDSGVFDAGALDGSANASFDSQGASDFYDASPAQANPYTQPWSGLHGGADNYNMTPFDVLYSRFAGTGVTPDALEEALAMTGWDIDRAIEFVVERHQLDSSLLEADGTRRQGSSYLGSRSGTSSPVPRLAGPPHAHQQSPLGAASGSRPLVVSRDSLYRAGRGDSPDPNGRWRSPGASPMGTPRSGTPTRGLGGRVCRYYLNGACLRADCKYSHECVPLPFCHEMRRADRVAHSYAQRLEGGVQVLAQRRLHQGQGPLRLLARDPAQPAGGATCAAHDAAASGRVKTRKCTNRKRCGW